MRHVAETLPGSGPWRAPIGGALAVLTAGCGAAQPVVIACPAGTEQVGGACVSVVAAPPPRATVPDADCRPEAAPAEAPLPIASSRCEGRAACAAECDGWRTVGCARLAAAIQAAGGPEQERVAALRTSCAGKHPEGCFELAWIEAEPSARKLELLAFACDGGFGAGCTELGHVAEREGDLARARPLHAKGCQLGHALGCTNLGVQQLEGKGGPKDAAQAAESFRRGCDGGHAHGCFGLALAYNRGNGVDRSYARAIELYTRACDGDDGPACSMLAEKYGVGEGVMLDGAQSTRLARKACLLDDAQGCFHLGRSWGPGRHNPEVSRAEGIELLEKACRLGESFACDELPRALADLQEKCEASVPFCNDLGELHERGRGVAKDLEKAAALYAKACSAGDGAGCFNLGELQRDRRGVRAARQSFELACAKGHAGGCREVGRVGTAR